MFEKFFYLRKIASFSDASYFSPVINDKNMIEVVVIEDALKIF